MKTTAVFVLVIASLAFATAVESGNGLGEDWRYELLEGDCSELTHYDILLTKEINIEGSAATDEAQYSGDRIVKCIVVTNGDDTAGRGQVAIVGGGIYQHTAELKFKATSGDGILFDVNIYGSS